MGGLVVTETNLPEVLLVGTQVHRDERGFLTEAFNRSEFESATGIRREWPQDNHSRSVRNVLRGIHFQLPEPQGKLVRCVRGRIFDVAVDLRSSSPRFGQWTGVIIDDDDLRAVWVPEGFGHGFLVLSEVADVIYKLTAPYRPGAGRAVRWDDATIGVDWPLDGPPILSDADRAAPGLDVAEVYG